MMKQKQLTHFPLIRSVHEFIGLNVDVAPVIEFVESKTEMDGGHWEDTLMPNDQFGPCRIVYRYAFVEVWRSRTKNGKQELVSVLDWEDDQFEVKLIVAAILDFSRDRKLSFELIRASEINSYIKVCVDDARASQDYYLFADLLEENVVVFQEVNDETWASLLMPKDHLGISQVIYRRECIEVLRYWTDDGDPELAMTIKWDDPQLLAKVMIAAIEDICADWSLVG